MGPGGRVEIGLQRTRTVLRDHGDSHAAVVDYDLVDATGKALLEDERGISIEIPYAVLDRVQARLSEAAGRALKPLTALERFALAEVLAPKLLVASFESGQPEERRDVTVNVDGAIAGAREGSL